MKRKRSKTCSRVVKWSGIKAYFLDAACLFPMFAEPCPELCISKLGLLVMDCARAGGRPCDGYCTVGGGAGKLSCGGKWGDGTVLLPMVDGVLPSLLLAFLEFRPPLLFLAKRFPMASSPYRFSKIERDVYMRRVWLYGHKKTIYVMQN